MAKRLVIIGGDAAGMNRSLPMFKALEAWAPRPVDADFEQATKDLKKLPKPKKPKPPKK